MTVLRTMLVIAALCLTVSVSAQDSANLCPNPGAEEAGEDGKPAGWLGTIGKSEWATDQVHSGARSLKLLADEPGTWSWTSEMVPLPRPDCQLAVSLWAKMDDVREGSGAVVVIYHTDENGVRLTTGTGGSGGLTLAGAGTMGATRDWQQYMTFSELTPETKGVRINLRLNSALGTVWFDDIRVFEHTRTPLSAPRPLRQGLWLDGPQGAAIVSCDGGEAHARRLQEALVGRGYDLPVIPHDSVDPATDPRELIVLGNLDTSKAFERLYLNYYAFADYYYPGAGGWTLRPQIDPFGTGANCLVLGASDSGGLTAGTRALLDHVRDTKSVLDVPLTVEIGEGYMGSRFYPWPGPGPYRAMKPAAEYLKTGDLAHAEEYKQYVYDNWFTETDESYADTQNKLHLIYHSRTMSWDLMDSCPVFTEAERLEIANELLRLMRSNQASGYKGLSGARYARGNHDIRNARSFYFGWRHFNKYYSGELAPELVSWQGKLTDFWTLVFSSPRTADEAISQHAVGGSFNCMLDVAFMQPDWAASFLADDLPRQMADRSIVCCNNMGQMVELGDTSPGDYPSGIFAKLGWYYRDGQYQFMIDKRGAERSSVDEAMRAFMVDLKPTPPIDHLGLRVIPADDLYFHSILSNRGEARFELSFDKLAFREGFDAQDEYLMMDGCSVGGHAYDDANSIGEFSAHGRRWLTGFDRFNAPTMAYHNSVTVARDGLGDAVPPHAAELIASDSGDGWGFTSTRLPGHSGVDWTRHILWLPGAYTCVLDEMTAREAGDYSFVLGWRSLGAPDISPGLLSVAQDEPDPTATVVRGKDLADAVRASSGQVYYYSTADGSLFYRGEAEGNFVESGMAVPENGEYAISMVPFRFIQRGIVQVSIDDEPIGQPIDLYAASAQTATDPVQLGTRQLKAGGRRVRFTVTGTNPDSGDYMLSVKAVVLRRLDGDPVEPDAGRNRFQLAFHPGLAATLDRDTEVMGPVLTPSPYRDQAINVLEQSIGRTLDAGQSAGFHNAFCATVGADRRDLQLRRLSDHTALIKCGDEVALIGASGSSAKASVAQLTASGRMFYVSPERVLLHEATVTWAGAPLATEQAPPDAVRAALQQAWEAASLNGDGAARPWDGRPTLQPIWTADLPATPTSLEPMLGQPVSVAVGTGSGTVEQFGADGSRIADFLTGGPVHALCAADLDADDVPELLVGSDDETLYALEADLFGRAKVRAIHAADITGDGVPEIMAGCGSMFLHCFDTAGEELWNWRSDYGVPSVITTADVLGEGRPRIITANALLSYSPLCTVLDENGGILRQWRENRYKATIQDIVVADLDGDGETSLLMGSSRGNVSGRSPDAKGSEVAWLHNMTRSVHSLTVLPTHPGLVAAGSESGYLAAFTEAGEKAWGIALSSAIADTALVATADGPMLAAICKDGKIFLCTMAGEVHAYYDAGARLHNLAVADLDGDGADELLITTAGPDALIALRLP